jgi:hypothetical protein
MSANLAPRTAMGDPECMSRFRVIRLPHPSDAEIREVLGDQVDSVLVCSRDDAVALRLALVVEHVRPGIPLIVRVHSRVVAAQLERAVSNIRVTSMARSSVLPWPLPASMTVCRG